MVRQHPLCQAQPAMTDRADAGQSSLAVEVLASRDGWLAGAWTASLRDSHALQASAVADILWTCAFLSGYLG